MREVRAVTGHGIYSSKMWHLPAAELEDLGARRALEEVQPAATLTPLAAPAAEKRTRAVERALNRAALRLGGAQVLLSVGRAARHRGSGVHPLPRLHQLPALCL